VEGKAARERRWPPPSYAGLRNVRVLALHHLTVVRFWEYLILFFKYLLELTSLLPFL